jgi:hypothetical protein
MSSIAQSDAFAIDMTAMPVIENGAYQKIYAPFSSSAPVVVGTVPASATVRKTVEQIKRNEVDPYNPVTRFSKYFPAPPLPYVCPERLPSKEPIPSTPECIPIQRFQGSAPGR